MDVAVSPFYPRGPAGGGKLPTHWEASLTHGGRRQAGCYLRMGLFSIFWFELPGYAWSAT